MGEIERYNVLVEDDTSSKNVVLFSSNFSVDV